MIDMNDALRVIENHRANSIAVPTMTGWLGWADVSRNNPSLDIRDGGVMGKASSLGLGIALAQPQRKVLVIDGDGSLLMNLGTLITIAGKAPGNLYHFVLDNGIYAVTGGQPTPNGGGYDLQGLARSAGYRASFEFDDLENLTSSMEEILNTKGPVFVSIKTIPNTDIDTMYERAGDRLRPMKTYILNVTRSINQ